MGPADHHHFVCGKATCRRAVALELHSLRGHWLAHTFANEYGPHGITVNNVCPGYTKTDRFSELSDAISARTGMKPEEVVAGWERQIPAGRLGKPEEFAAVVAFLASERASYVNGTSIAIDGGIVRSLL